MIKSVLSLIYSNLFVCSLALRVGQIQLVHIYFYTDMVLCFMKFGQQTYRLDVPGDVAMNVNGKAELIMIKSVIPNKSTD